MNEEVEDLKARVHELEEENRILKARLSGEDSSTTPLPKTDTKCDACDKGADQKSQVSGASEEGSDMNLLIDHCKNDTMNRMMGALAGNLAM